MEKKQFYFFDLFLQKKKGAKSKTLAAESRLFWMSLVVFPIIWIFLLVISLLSFKLTNVVSISSINKNKEVFSFGQTKNAQH